MKPLSQPSRAAPPIRSQAELDAYLKAHSATPIDRLTAGARERFLMSLVFGSKGLGGFDSTDLANELTQDQIRDVLALFGEDMVAYAPESQLINASGVAVNPTSARSGIGELERRYNLFYRADRDAQSLDDAAHAAVLAERFDALFPEARDPSALRRLSDRDLRLLSRAAGATAMRTSRPEHVDAFEAAFAERDRRRQVATEDVELLQRLLLAMRRFDGARRLHGDHPEAQLAPLPVFHDPLGPSGDRTTVWRLDDDDGTLTRVAVDLAATQIVVTASCHFSQDAAEDIAADPALGPAFERHARWLTLPPGNESIELARKWNQRFPQSQVAMAYDRSEWAMLPSWETPVFYIVRDGKVIDSVVGWTREPAESRRQPLIDALRRAGLLPSTDAVTADTASD